MINYASGSLLGPLCMYLSDSKVKGHGQCLVPASKSFENSRSHRSKIFHSIQVDLNLLTQVLLKKKKKSKQRTLQDPERIRKDRKENFRKETDWQSLDICRPRQLFYILALFQMVKGKVSILYIIKYSIIYSTMMSSIHRLEPVKNVCCCCLTPTANQRNLSANHFYSNSMFKERNRLAC